MRNIFIYFITALFCVASTASGQTTAQSELTDDLTAPIGLEWETFSPDASRSSVIEALSRAGWPKPEVAKMLNSEAYMLYTKPRAPGLVSYLAVPLDSLKSPVEFSPLPTEATQAFFNGRPTAEQIRKEIIDGMQAAIDALCGMNARPTIIRAQASAFGVVEVEATWMAQDVCEG